MVEDRRLGLKGCAGRAGSTAVSKSDGYPMDASSGSFDRDSHFSGLQDRGLGWNSDGNRKSWKVECSSCRWSGQFID